MNLPPPIRAVNLIDGRSPGRPLLSGRVYRDCPVETLEDVEAACADARRSAAVDPSGSWQHAHWDWRQKTETVVSGEHRLVAIECESELQGVMAVSRDPRPARLGPGQVVYIDF